MNAGVKMPTKRSKPKRRVCWVWWHKGDEACAGMYAAQTASYGYGDDETPFETPKCCGIRLKPYKDGGWVLMREVIVKEPRRGK